MLIAKVDKLNDLRLRLSHTLWELFHLLLTMSSIRNLAATFGHNSSNRTCISDDDILATFRGCEVHVPEPLVLMDNTGI